MEYNPTHPFEKKCRIDADFWFFFFLTGYMPYANKTFEFKEDPDIRPKEY